MPMTRGCRTGRFVACVAAAYLDIAAIEDRLDVPPESALCAQAGSDDTNDS
jgi:hypothetical protein